MAKTAGHSKLPWKVGILGEYTPYIYNKDVGIADITSLGFADNKEPTANAEFIVRACNNHYKLVEACKDILDIVQFASDSQLSVPTNHVINKLTEAIKEVEK